MRALRVLAEAQASLCEEQVYAKAKRDGSDTAYFHGALRTLVVLGLAEVVGPRGGQRYTITQKGRDKLASTQGQS